MINLAHMLHLVFVVQVSEHLHSLPFQSDRLLTAGIDAKRGVTMHDDLIGVRASGLRVGNRRV